MSLPEVRIELFEGPFDLLLELAASQKVDLTEVSLARLTDDFLRYIEDKQVPVREMGEWLVVASRLLLLKARMIGQEDLSSDEEEEGERFQERIRAYQLYREQSEAIRLRWGALPLRNSSNMKSIAVKPVVIHTAKLQEAFERALTRLPRPERARAHLVRYGRTLEQCLVALKSILRTRPSFVFQQEVVSENRNEVAVSFLAALEMHRNREVQLEQKDNFEQLVVRRV